MKKFFKKKKEEKSEENSFLNYEKSKEQLENLILNPRKALHSWKMIAFFCIGITAVSIGGVIHLSNRSTLIPYVIEVDETGNAKAINPAYQITYNPNDENVKYFLKEFIKNSRWITLDAVVQNNIYRKSLSYLTKPMQEKLREISEQEDLNKLIQDKFSRDVRIKSIVKLAGTENTFQIKWNECLYAENGVLQSNLDYVGLFSIEIVQPKTIAELEVNPLGIMIKDFHFSFEK